MLLAELVRRGWDVDLISSPINYMRGTAPEPYAGKRYVRETIDGIVHHWVRATEDVHSSKRARAMNYATFAKAATLRGVRLKRPDVIWASSPPLSVGSVGATLARRFRRPWLFEVRDLWPESAAAVGWLNEGGKLYRVIDRLARRYATGATAVIVPTPGLVEPVKTHGATNVHVITGALLDAQPDEAIRARVREELKIDDDTCLFAYVGAHGAANGLDLLLDAAKALQDEAAQFVLAGDGSDRERIEQRVADEGIANVRLLGTVAKDDVAPILMAADVCLHMLRPDPLFASALPTKVLEYLGTHRPFVTTVPGLPEELARESGGGFATTVPALAEELRRWIAMPPAERLERGEQAFAYGRERFGLDATVDRLEQLLRNTMNGK
jgi:glycosyltransferase involved in cell wall biosynthesis